MRVHLPRAGTALFASLLVSAACSSISGTDDDPPEAARVLLEGTAPGPLEVVASTNFTRFTDQSGETSVQLHASDTLEASLPLDQTWQMAGSNVGFYVRVMNPDSEIADIRLRVYIDGDERYDQAAELSDASVAWIFVASDF